MVSFCSNGDSMQREIWLSGWFHISAEPYRSLFLQLGCSEFHGDVLAYYLDGGEHQRDLTYFTPLPKIFGKLSLAYSDLEDSSQVFELRIRARNLRQCHLSVTQYLSTLKKLWQELDLFNFCEWKDPEDGICIGRWLQRNEFMIFWLATIATWMKLGGVVSLESSPFPTIDEVFAEVRREENHR